MQATWAYDAVGQVKTLTYGNTARATYTYDSTARTTGIRHSKSDGTLLAGYEYSHNSAGIPTGVVEGNGDRVTWSYDSAYRLTREQRSGTNAYDLTYTWDGAGNRLTKLASGTTTTYTYNAGDALTLENAAGTVTTFAYDNAGNTSTQNAAGSVTTYTWDDENRMTGILLPSGGGTWTMAYNPSGLRREKQAAGTTTRFVWDTVGSGGPGTVPSAAGGLSRSGASASRLLQETDGDNATTAHYTAGLGAYGPTVSQRRSSTSSFLHGSLLGTIESLTAADQSVSDTYTLDAWGRQITASGSTTNPHRYIGLLGYYTEPSLSLDYVRARWLRPSTGGWLSVDPVWRGIAYAYSACLPALLTDPEGARPWVSIGDALRGGGDPPGPLDPPSVPTSPPCSVSYDPITGKTTWTCGNYTATSPGPPGAGYPPSSIGIKFPGVGVGGGTVGGSADIGLGPITVGGTVSGHWPIGSHLVIDSQLNIDWIPDPKIKGGSMGGTYTGHGWTFGGTINFGPGGGVTGGSVTGGVGPITGGGNIGQGGSLTGWHFDINMGGFFIRYKQEERRGYHTDPFIGAGWRSRF